MGFLKLLTRNTGYEFKMNKIVNVIMSLAFIVVASACMVLMINELSK